MIREDGKEKVKCPYCGHTQNVFMTEDTVCRGLFFKCKNRECRREFELKINRKK